MKILLRLLFGLVVLLVVVVTAAYLDGRTLPVDHTASVTGTVDGTPSQVFTTIADVVNGPTFRPQVQSVQILDWTPGHERWIEDLGHGQTMHFQTIASAPGALRVVRLDDPKAAYGGTWTYQLAPGPTSGTTTLTITEKGFIRPPLYRFVMQHIMGVTYNLNVYLKDIQGAFAH